MSYEAASKEGQLVCADAWRAVPRLLSPTDSKCSLDRRKHLQAASLKLFGLLLRRPLVDSVRALACPPHQASQLAQATRMPAWDPSIFFFVWGKAHLDGSHEDVAVVRQAGRERRAIVERVLGLALALLDRLLESVNVLPVREHVLLRLGEREVRRRVVRGEDRRRVRGDHRGWALRRAGGQLARCWAWGRASLASWLYCCAGKSQIAAAVVVRAKLAACFARRDRSPLPS